MENSLIRQQSARRTTTVRFLILATGVLLLAAAMRFLLLQEVPPGLSQDEVLNADIASFIRQGYYALFFAEGYGHEPLYHYWSVPFQVLLGDNVLSIRLPAAYLGLLLIALTMRWAGGTPFSRSWLAKSTSTSASFTTTPDRATMPKTLMRLSS